MEKSPFLGEIFDNINEGVYILNRQGDYIYCNSAFLKMVGATREDALKLNAFRLVPEGQVSVSVAVLAFEQKKKLSIINNVVTPKGYRYRQMATATPIFDSVGEVEYMLVEMIRLDLFKKRYQKAILAEDESCIDLGSFGDGPDAAAPSFVAESPAMKALLAVAAQVAQVDSTVLICGETGTGKEVLTNFIHSHSRRSRQPMVEINCAALPENLLEAELFGYERGAFTGALDAGKPGMVEQANGGTLFLDEINSLPLALQGKLLRVLESRKSKRLGAVAEREIDFRLLAATNQDLKSAVEAGSFRADLYYRLNVIPLEIPPLRERREDIAPLALFFLDQFCQKYGRNKVFSKTVFEQMQRYDWPGNVRELKNVVERLLITSAIGTMEIYQVPGNLLGGAEKEPLPAQIYPASWESVYQYDPAAFSLKSYMDLCEKQVIADALKRCGSSYKAAALLKTDQSTVVRKRHKYGL